jgi:hypothetical protein
MVISHRANSIKRSANIEALQRVIESMPSHRAGIAHEMVI